MSLAFHTLGGEGQDVVLVHGFGSDRLSWLGNVRALMAVARVHSLDLPGHGESSLAVGTGSPATLARKVQETLHANGIGRAHFIGHSLGGGVALWLAGDEPDRIASLALIAPAGLGAGVDEEFLGTYPELNDETAAAKLLWRLVVKPEVIGKQIVQRVLQHLRREGARQALRKIASALLQSTGELRFAAQAVCAAGIPRLTVWGEKDTINPRSRDHLEAFGGERMLVQDAAHLPHIEAMATVNAGLVAFLEANMLR